MLRRLLPDPFLVLLVATVALATIVPAHGLFAIAVRGLATISVMVLFFFHGAKLAREQVIAGIAHWRLHLAILAATFLFFPVIGLAGTRLLAGRMPADLVLGLLFLCCLPSTVQSSIAFVGLARGNVGAAVAAASASQMLGIVATPALMALLGSAGPAATASGRHGGGLADIGEIVLQILVPFVAGHLLRPWIGGWVGRNRRWVNYTDRSTILIAVYSAFSAAVLGGLWQRLPPAAIGLLVLVCGVLLGLALGFTWVLGGLCGFAREDRIALLFCGTKKSLVQGVPMARVLFAPTQAGVVVLPLMLFHQMQLMVCAIVAGRLARSAERRERRAGLSGEPNPV